MDAKAGKGTKNELKILVVGNSGTGKTSFVNKWTKDVFSENYKATIVSEFSYKIYEHKGKFYKVQLWDLAGMDNNVCITKIFSKDSHGCIVLSDVLNEKSLQETVKWKNSVDESTKFIDGDFIPSVLVRNKIDLLEGEETKDDDQVKEFAEQNKFINVFKTSAKMGIGIQECMEFIISTIIERMENCSQNKENPFEKDRANIVLETSKTGEKSQEQGGFCC